MRDSSDLLSVLKRVVELAMPNLRSYYRVVRKARVVRSYASDGRYVADVQPLQNDESDDPKEPVLAGVEIPVIWGGAARGLICPPKPGTLCDLEYYDGDPNYPRISNFRGGGAAPACALDALVIQQADGTRIEIDPAANIIRVTPANLEDTVGGNRIEEAAGNHLADIGGDKTETVSGTALQEAAAWTIMAATAVTLQAPQINLVGALSASAAGGGTATATEKSHRSHEGSYVLTGPMTVNGSVQINGNLDVTGTFPCNTP